MNRELFAGAHIAENLDIITTAVLKVKEMIPPKDATFIGLEEHGPKSVKEAILVNFKSQACLSQVRVRDEALDLIGFNFLDAQHKIWL